MLVKNKKIILFTCLCLSALFATVGCGLLNSTGGGNSVEPVKRLRVTIDESQRKELFTQFQKFADKHTFKYVFSDYGTTDHFLVELWGENILITASDDPGNSRSVSIFFSGKYSGSTVADETVDELLIELKSFLSEIPNVTITEEK